MDRLRILRRKAQQWGGELKLVSFEVYHDLKDRDLILDAPFSSYDLGINYRTKTVYTNEESPAPWTEVVHDMGHVFACHKEPYKSDEFEFLGWEYALARELRGVMSWLTGNRDYGVDPHTDLGDLSRAAVLKMLAERLQAAKKAGLLDRRGRARAIR